MKKILVVDDEQRICRFIARSLGVHGYHVRTAGTAREALRLTREGEYALIILDLMLPDLDGYEVLRHLTEGDSGQRVLILSAIADVDSRVKCLRLGAVDYLVKPFAVAELIARVQLRVGESAADSMPRFLEAGGLRLDLQRRVLQAGGRTIVLTPREFQLLEHLMRRPNEVCTRFELLGEVWGYAFDPGSNVVEVCVRRLRTKLEGDLIETVRNVGYCFVAS
jgi:two-component system copper resistance phosphate regulon response regulator CusR